MDSLDSVREMITEMLTGVSPDARLTELADSPDGKWYTLRIHVPGTISKPFLVPKRFVKGPAPHPTYLQMLQNVLRVEVLMQRSRIAVDRSRETLAGLAPPNLCPRCSAPMAPGEAVRFEHGEVFHLKCRPLPTR
jgi:hypothetical protein